MGISCKRNSRTEQVQRDKSCACNLFARHCFVPLLLQEKYVERTDLTFGRSVPKWENFDKCDRQVRRYIRLTELIAPLLDKVDEKSITIGAGTELSFLNVKVQSQVNDYLERELCTVTEKQAGEIHKLYEQDKLSEKALCDILRGKEDNEKFSVDTKKLRSCFPKEYSSAQCKKILWEILDAWFKGKDIENEKAY